MDEMMAAHFERAYKRLEEEEEPMGVEILKTLEKFSSFDAGTRSLITETLTKIVDAPEHCQWETYARTLETPAEYCENVAIEDSDYCAYHD